MPQVVLVVLGIWVVFAPLVFARLPPRWASVVVLLGGWMLLPTARYPEVAGENLFYDWITPIALPSEFFATKATAIGVAALLGVILFDRRSVRALRPSFWDLPIVAWCLVPMASALVNRFTVEQAAAATVAQTLAWGVPYLMGRLYAADPLGRDAWALGLAVAGLAAIPFALVEVVRGPVFYRAIYGFHPFWDQGMTRYLGYRPLLMFEDGNQSGAFFASAALAGAWLWRTGRLRHDARVPGPAVAAALVGMALLTQSAGAVVLMLGGLLTLEMMGRIGRVWPLALVLGVVLLGVGVRALNLVDAKALALKTPPGRVVVAALMKTDRGSFGWRLRIEERAARLALKKPLLGWGRSDWWRQADRPERAWGLTGLALGMYGLVGWGLLAAILVVPVARFLAGCPPRLWLGVGGGTAAALAAIFALNALDAILNGAFLLPLVALAGGLTVPKLAGAGGGRP